MSNRNKEKGKSFERDVCETFKSVFHLNFQRIPNSGAFIGGSNAVRMENMSQNQIQLSMGDIICPKELSNLVIECKARKDFSFNLLFDRSRELEEWIDQVLVDFNKINHGIFLVIFKINNKGQYVVYDAEQFPLIVTSNALVYQYKKKYVVHSFDVAWLEMNKNLLLQFGG
jgi:Holliday junction resolvase